MSSMATISSPAWHAASTATISAAMPLKVGQRGLGALQSGNFFFGRGDGGIAVACIEIQAAVALGVAPKAFDVGTM